MALLSVQHLAFLFGLLGNIVSFLVFLSPIPTFYTICKKKSSEGFHPLPYSVALFSASLLLYYAYLKTNAYMIVIINAIGCVIEIIYLFIHIIYAPKIQARLGDSSDADQTRLPTSASDESDQHQTRYIRTMSLIFLFNVGGLGVIMLVSLLCVEGSHRVALVGWICVVFNLAVFVAPFSIMRQVIRTKSVEFMPFTLSFFLTLCATMWFFYGFFIKDYYIAFPNIIGFLFGVAQMILYLVYKKAKKDDSSDIEKNLNKDIGNVSK